MHSTILIIPDSAVMNAAFGALVLVTCFVHWRTVRHLVRRVEDLESLEDDRDDLSQRDGG